MAHLPAGAWRGEGLAKALYWSALAHDRLGERAKALEKLDRLLVAWRRADPDLALLGEARALRRRLAGG